MKHLVYFKESNEEAYREIKTPEIIRLMGIHTQKDTVENLFMVKQMAIKIFGEYTEVNLSDIKSKYESEEKFSHDIQIYNTGIPRIMIKFYTDSWAMVGMTDMMYRQRNFICDDVWGLEELLKDIKSGKIIL